MLYIHWLMLKEWKYFTLKVLEPSCGGGSDIMFWGGINPFFRYVGILQYQSGSEGCDINASINFVLARYLLFAWCVEAYMWEQN